MPGVTINSSNVPSTGFNVGTSPAGLLEDSSASHLYVTDSVANTVSTYTIGSNGVPTLTGAAQTENGPAGMTFDLSQKYLYVVNTVPNTVGGYIVGSGGALTRSSVAGSVGTGTGPTCVTVLGAPSNANPSHGIYMYISNSLTNNITAEQLAALSHEFRTPLNGVLGMARLLERTELSAEQAAYLGIPVDGPYKSAHYRY